MKKSLHVIGALLVTVALLCQSNPMSAATKFKTPSRQRTQVEHLITVGASVGYSTLLENYDIFAKSKSTIFQKEKCKKNSKSSKLSHENLLLFLSFEELSKAFQRLFNPMKFCRS